MRFIVTVLPILLILLQITGCSQDPINYETQLFQKNNFYYKKNQSKPYTGPIFSLYPNGKKKNSGNLINGGKDGLWTEWYQNGKIKAEEYYKDGKADDIWVSWHENNKLKLKGTFKDGKANGLRTEWYQNGQKKEEGYFKNNEFDGQWTKWYPNG